MKEPAPQLIPVEINPFAGRVVWAHVPWGALRKPFFLQSLEKMRRESSGLSVCETNLEPILLAAEAPVQPPSGFIFHMSRSGSTLMANALRNLRDALVISEASVLSMVLTAGEKTVDASSRSILLRGIVNALGIVRREPTSPYFIKFGCWNLLQLSLIRAVWPGVPWVFMMREPVSVIVSNLRNRAWLDARTRPASRKLLGWSGAARRRMSDEEFCARAIGLFCHIAAEHLDETGRVIDYSELNADAMANFARRCGVPLTPSEEAAIARSMLIYSKDESGSQVFEPDDRALQTATTPLIRQLAERHTIPAYERLRSLSIK
jgi:hypothetical protein